MKSTSEIAGWIFLVGSAVALGTFFLRDDPVWLLVSIMCLGVAALTGLFGRRL